MQAEFHISPQAVAMSVGRCLAAEFGGARKRIPSGGGPIAIGFAKARRGRDHAVLEARSALIADAIERCEAFGGEFRRLLEDGRAHILLEPRREAVGDQPVEARHMAKREQHVGDGSTIGRSHITWPSLEDEAPSLDKTSERSGRR